MDKATAYVTLGIDETTSLDEARIIYRRRLRLLHPDLHGTHDPQLQLEAERATRQLATAWQTLQERWSIEAQWPISSMAAATGPIGPPSSSTEMVRPTPPRPPGADECSECGGVPIRRARIRTVRRGQVAVDHARCCRRCGLNAFRDAQATTISAGWMSPTGPVRTMRAVTGNLRAWRRFRRLDDVLPPLRPVVTTVVAPAEMVRPVLRRPIPVLLTTLLVAILLGALVWGGVALAAAGGTAHRDRSPFGAQAAEMSAAGGTTATGPLAGLDPDSFPGCSNKCRIARSLRVTVGGQPADLLLVSTAGGRTLHALRFYLVRDADFAVLWSGPGQPMHAYVSKRLGNYRGSVLRQDGTGHVFIDLLTSASESFIVVLDLGDGRAVSDFGSMQPDVAGHYRFSTDSPGADTVDIDKTHVFDIALPRPGGAHPYYDLDRWDGTDYVARGCARTLVDGGLGEIRPAGTCA